ncbi:hypothetical protein BRAS3809_1890010 [Bradyrhizobium sp. STM 3809]|nr:hypothetical protein BRAS3809_1890010 [Bradyrhizobium sp. STM 3809]
MRRRMRWSEGDRTLKGAMNFAEGIVGQISMLDARFLRTRY